MSLNITTIEDTLRSWLSAVTGETVIFAEGNGTRPTTPFHTIKLISLSKIGKAEVRTPDTNGDRDVITNYELSVSFQFFGPGSLQTGADVSETLDLETGTTVLDVIGLYYFRNNGVQDLSELLKGDYEKRAGLDVVFGIQATTSEAVGLIENINMTGVVKDPAGNDAHTLAISQ